jgi:hypothetical protein
VRRTGAVILSALALAGCGSTVTSGQAVRAWADNSRFASNLPRIISDARALKTLIDDPAVSAGDLHTFSTVFFQDVSAANASLPTPDAQLTTLLSQGYTNLASAAQTAYGAAGNHTKRAQVLSFLIRGAEDLSLARMRLGSAEQG